MSVSQLQTQSTVTASMVHGYENAGADTMRAAIRQDPMSITLDGPAIFTLATSLVLSVHFFQPSFITLIVAVVPVLLYVKNDFKNYLNLGPGGTPSTFHGYLIINWFRLWALRDPFTPPPPDPTSFPSVGVLKKSPLPQRAGSRPTVAGIAPQRQVDQQGPEECYMALRKVLESHGSKHSDDIGLGTSCFEKHGLGLFARHPVNNTCMGEICHVHSSDHSMHMNLHPDDVREVLAKGWGQRHPLAWKGRWLQMPVPRQFVMVYAPRTMDEVRIVCRIIEAAGWWVMAKEQTIDCINHSPSS
ncbi:hypothetical protein E8E14_005029 [Neopestalotiopsis sp. 37M]|nr:hypothetical protein E8E14_005029 [Neopestalotiopsis sp. 37M]